MEGEKETSSIDLDSLLPQVEEEDCDEVRSLSLNQIESINLTF